jgi:hypothetical protein
VKEEKERLTKYPTCNTRTGFRPVTWLYPQTLFNLKNNVLAFSPIPLFKPIKDCALRIQIQLPLPASQLAGHRIIAP